MEPKLSLRRPTATVAMIMSGIWTAQALAADPVELTYQLPHARIAFGSSYELEQCPTVTTDLRVRVTTEIVPKYVAGDEVSLDASAGFLVKRSVALEYFPNGTLHTFNAESAGQGGEVVAAAIKAAATILVLDAPQEDRLPPLMGELRCLDHVARQVREVDATRDRIARLEALMASGGGGPGISAELERARSSLLRMRAALTIAPEPVVHTPLSAIPDGKLPDGYATDGEKLVWRSNLPAPDFGVWFGSFSNIPEALEAAGVTGSEGFRLVFSGPTPAGAKPASTPIQSLWYREPVGYSAEIRRREADFSCNSSPATCAVALGDWKAAQRKLSVPVPQAGPARTVPYAGSGIFGNRAVSATFREDGSLAKVGYTSAGGSDQLAGVIDAAVVSATALRDAEAQRVARQLELETNRRALQELLSEAAENSSEDAAGEDVESEGAAEGGS